MMEDGRIHKANLYYVPREIKKIYSENEERQLGSRDFNCDLTGH
jgi:hypothetical protein